MTTPEIPKQEQKVAPPTESKPDVIPAHYKGMPSEVVEELWQSPVYVDAEKNKAEAERRQQALEAIKKGETDREAVKQQQLSERYSKLSPEQKNEFPTAQTDAGKILNEHIQGRREIEGLSPEESFVLGKLKTTYEEFKRENPDKPFAFDFSRDIDRSVYNNLAQRLSFKILEGKQRISDQEKANIIREELDVHTQEIKKEGLLLPEEENKPEVQVGGNETALTKLQQLLEARAAKSKNPQIYRDLFEKTRQENNREKIASMLLGEINLRKRTADYPLDPNYQKTWEYGQQNTTVAHREEKDWLYRGNFSTKEKPTETRGSLNINITEDALKELDTLIQSGVIDANYKFGRPDTRAAADARHDAITIYFLEQPTPEAVRALSEIAKKYLRGDDLIGNKISDGFYMSEIGSISDTHAKELTQKLQSIDPELAKTVDGFLVSNRGVMDKKERYAMSEAQYYSTKEMLDFFGVEVRYNRDKGFEIIKK